MLLTKHPVPILIKKTTLSFKGDKSISHRAAIFSALNDESSALTNYSAGKDCNSTLKILKSIGADVITEDDNIVKIRGPLFSESRYPDELFLDAENSGTTARLFSGLLSGLNIPCTISGDQSLMKRPMRRIATPLENMDAKIELSRGDVCPIKIPKNEGLKGIDYNLPVASAQIKSAILIAGLFADGETKVNDPFQTRDHTERMLGLKISGNTISVNNQVTFTPGRHFIPGDLSSAAFFIALALTSKDKELIIENVSLNPGRLSFVKVLQKMGGEIFLEKKGVSMNEPYGEINVFPSSLYGGIITEKESPGLIDEIPLLSVLALHTKNGIQFENVGELRHKESDRIKSVLHNLDAFGAKFSEKSDGFDIYPLKREYFKDSAIKTFDDHRIAMSMTIAGLSYGSTLPMDNRKCIDISFPDFFNKIQQFLG